MFVFVPFVILWWNLHNAYHAFFFYCVDFCALINCSHHLFRRYSILILLITEINMLILKLAANESIARYAKRFWWRQKLRNPKSKVNIQIYKPFNDKSISLYFIFGDCKFAASRSIRSYRKTFFTSISYLNKFCVRQKSLLLHFQHYYVINSVDYGHIGLCLRFDYRTT